MQLAELQRRYKEKQRELARLQRRHDHEYGSREGAAPGVPPGSACALGQLLGPVPPWGGGACRSSLETRAAEQRGEAWVGGRWAEGTQRRRTRAGVAEAAQSVTEKDSDPMG